MPILAVASPLATMDASGEGYVEKQQHTTAAHTSITHKFYINAVPTADLFTAFSWADVDTEGNVDVSSGQTDFTISLNSAQFIAALAQVIADASGGKLSSAGSVSTNTSYTQSVDALAATYVLGANKPTARTVMDREVRKEVEDALNTNGVLEYLEGDSLGGFSLRLDASGGAADMASKLGSNNTAALRNLLLQFPNRTDVIGLTDASGARLPVMAGDSIAFVFNVSPKVSIQEQDQSGDAPTANNATTTGAEASSALSVATAELSTGTRKIAFIVNVVSA